MIKTLLIATLLLFPLLFTQARSISDVRIFISDDIHKDCQYVVKDVEGCYASPDKIYVSSKLSLFRFKYVLLHEIGHFLMDGVSEEIYNEVFNPTSFMMPMGVLREFAANEFAFWWITNQATPDQEQFFIGLFQ